MRFRRSGRLLKTGRRAASAVASAWELELFATTKGFVYTAESGQIHRFDPGAATLEAAGDADAPGAPDKIILEGMIHHGFSPENLFGETLISVLRKRASENDAGTVPFRCSTKVLLRSKSGLLIAAVHSGTIDRSSGLVAIDRGTIERSSGHR